VVNLSNNKIRICLLLLIALPAATVAEAQLFDRALKSIQRGAERAVEREAERRTDQAVTDTIECALGDSACEQQKAGQPAAASGQRAAGSAAGSTAAAPAGQHPGEGARALRVNSRGKLDVPLPAALPERFTIEVETSLTSFVNDF
jgi:hypothetical protein